SEFSALKLFSTNIAFFVQFLISRKVARLGNKIELFERILISLLNRWFECPRRYFLLLRSEMKRAEDLGGECRHFAPQRKLRVKRLMEILLKINKVGLSSLVLVRFGEI
ncbi:hypothetical protein, partial [Planktotalea sp.]|uniref:hypothetical protein n=1 Tax=Planktotalea sp. TaxID=2029877 RepID=UPI00329996B5